MVGDQGEKTEKATPRRREKARREGQVPLSQEVGVAIAVLVLAAAIAVLLPWSGRLHVQAAHRLLEDAYRHPLTVPTAVDALRTMGWEAAMIAGPVGLMAMVLGTASGLFQVGFSLNWANAGLKWKRLDPQNWGRKVFSVELPFNLAKSMFKGIGVVMVAVLGVWDLPEDLWRFSGIPAAGVALELQSVALAVAYRVGAALTVLALIDVLWTRHRHEQRLMMSRQEVKDELKESEGNPLVRGAMRRRMRDIKQRRLRELVGEASVVTTNPTHFAVALRYWRGKDAAPVVVAKGVDFRAARIKQYAREVGIPVVEDKPLARALYAVVQEGQSVPVELYRSVARLLAIVYRRRGYLRGTERL